MSSLFSLKEKVIVITGGCGQLGRQYTRAILENQGKVAILDRFVNQEWLEELQAKFQDQVYFFEADVTDKKSLQNCLKLILQKFSSVHGLVNNAALDSPPNSPASENGPFETYPEESFDKVMNVNTKGVFLCCQVFGGHMATDEGGSIINIGSIYGERSPNQNIYKYREEASGQPFYKPVAYSVSKSSLTNLTRYLATYWAKKNIRVNTLTLAGVFNSQDQNFLENYNNLHPMGRMAKENEYNGSIIFLLSEASSYMNGSNMIVDGGWTAW